MQRFSLPAIRLVIALVVVTLVAGGASRIVRRHFAGQFATIAATESGDADAVYQTLLAMEGNGIDALLRNAFDKDPLIAKRSRNMIFVRIDTWLAKYASTDRDELNGRLLKLIAKIDKKSPELTASGQRWAKQLASRLMDLAPRLHVQDRLALIGKAGLLLSNLNRLPVKPDYVVENDGFRTSLDQSLAQSLEQRQEKLGSEPRSFEAIAEATSIEEQPNTQAEEAAQSATLSVESVVTDMQLWRKPGITAGRDPVATAPKDAFAQELQPIIPQPIMPQEVPGLEPTPPLSRSFESIAPAKIYSLTDRQLLAYLLENANAFRDLPKQREQKPQAMGPSGGSDRSVNGQASEDEAEQEPVLTLAEKRLFALRDALVERGYTSVRLDQIEQFLSPNEKDRIRLVERLLTTHTGDPSRMLLLLAKDTSSDVRLAALTGLGSSREQVLIKAAWSLSLRDTDPRIASLAERLQAKLR